MQKEKKYYTLSEALLKAASYCAYQERSHNEVLAKLGELGVYGIDADELLLKLIAQNYLNEERFAQTYAGSKFRVKKWGRLKIKRELQLKGVSAPCIQIAMKEIDPDDYFQTLQKLVEAKFQTSMLNNPLEIGRKTYQYLATKGYESDLIWDAIRLYQAQE